jgi:hypothetical protein
MRRHPLIRSVQIMSTATKDYPSGGLRVSDADRDRAIAELSEHFQAGRLTAEELDDRTGRALQARTTADLAALFTDLPRRQVPVTSAAPTQASPAPFQLARVPAVPIAILAAVALAGLLSGHPGLIVLVPVIVLFIIRRLAGSGWRRRRSYDR